MGAGCSFVKIKVIKVGTEGVKMLEELRSHQRANEGRHPVVKGTSVSLERCVINFVGSNGSKRKT